MSQLTTADASEATAPSMPSGPDISHFKSVDIHTIAELQPHPTLPSRILYGKPPNMPQPDHHPFYDQDCRACT